MTPQTLVILAVTVGIAAFVQGGSGLGFALVVAPVVSILDPSLLPVFVLASMIPLNLYVTWRERGSLDLRGARWIAVARLAATPGGLALLWLIPDRSIGLFVGVSTVLAALVSLAAPAFAPGRVAYVGAGLVTGLTETATGVGGPRSRWSTSTGPRRAALHRRGLLPGGRSGLADPAVRDRAGARRRSGLGGRAAPGHRRGGVAEPRGAPANRRPQDAAVRPRLRPGLRHRPHRGPLSPVRPNPADVRRYGTGRARQ